jgi:hypothetical protein
MLGRSPLVVVVDVAGQAAEAAGAVVAAALRAPSPMPS